eukprot:356295-Chlamydomonas_euryale.AAC.24
MPTYKASRNAAGFYTATPALHGKTTTRTRRSHRRYRRARMTAHTSWCTFRSPCCLGPSSARPAAAAGPRLCGKAAALVGMNM